MNLTPTIHKTVLNKDLFFLREQEVHLPFVCGTHTAMKILPLSNRFIQLESRTSASVHAR